MHSIDFKGGTEGRPSIRPVKVCTQDAYALTGMGNGVVITRGCADISLGTLPCRVHLVPIDFPIECDGILRVDFLRSNSAILSFPDERLIAG